MILKTIDSHTGGEPTRLVLQGGPDLGEGPLEKRVGRFRGKFDEWRSAIVNEPRGSDTVVGALLCSPHRQDCRFGVIFFNNVGYLGMCGHGTIGVVASLAHLGKVEPGSFRIDTPVGPVDVELHADGRVSVANVSSRRHSKDTRVRLPDGREVKGDIAWGGNWFYLVEDHGQRIEFSNVEALTAYTWEIRRALKTARVAGAGNAEIDHIELFEPGSKPGVHSRNFVLCPGKAYDRSPCGTGTSAKLACLAADGKLAENETWIQESVIGSIFEGRYRWLDKTKGEIAPTITGSAHVTGESTLILDPKDPFCWGIR